MLSAVILRVSRSAAVGEPHVWYEYALLVNNRIKRQAPHMMASADSAARYARQKGYEPVGNIVDVTDEVAASPGDVRAFA